VADFDVICASALAPDALAGLELHFLEAVVTRSTPPVLLIHNAPGRYLSLGRYHLYGGQAERAGISAFRRQTGGRIVGAGEGWTGLALILPTRTALLKDETAPLRPEQIMNRYARGLLNALRTLGLNCFYPGRDAITFEHREIAMCTYNVNESGAMIFEAMLAVNRGMEEVVHDLEHFDPESILPCRMYTPDSATKLVRELDRDIEFNELADVIAAGYEGLLGEVRRRELTADEAAQGGHRGRALANSGWLNRLAVAESFRSATNRMAAQLGSIEARIALKSDGMIEAATLSGDFIANAPAIAQLESELRGNPLDLASVSRVVTRTFSHDGNFILGAGELSNIVRLIAAAK
jgi:lipoate-protein ligase A